MFNPKVSIIILSYNQDKFLKNSIDSVINQTYKNLEIIISDNGSTDNSKSIIEEYLSDQRVVFLDYNKNDKVTKRSNQAFSQSTGDFISLLYSDDYYLEDKIETQMNIFKDLSKEWGVVHGPVFREEVSTGERSIGQVTKAHGSCLEDLLDNFLDGFINPISPLARRKCWEEYPSFEEVFIEGEGLYLRFAMRYKFFYYQDPLAVMREHNINTGKSLKQNIETHHYMIQRLGEYEEFPEKYKAKLRKNSSLFKENVSWHFVRTSSDLKWARRTFVWALQIYPKNIIRPRILLGVIMSFTPIFFLKVLNRIINYFLKKEPFQPVEKYY